MIKLTILGWVLFIIALIIDSVDTSHNAQLLSQYIVGFAGGIFLSTLILEIKHNKNEKNNNSRRVG